MAEEPDYILELSCEASAEETPAALDASAGHGPSAGAQLQEDSASTGAAKRKWIGVHFTCCDVYSRIWRNREGTGYVGHCPRCSRKVEARIGPNGVTARFFTAG
jgi:hypothetical protein